MSFLLVSKPIRTGHESYIMLFGTCDGVTAKTFNNLEEANAELRVVENVMAMGSGAVTMELVNDAGGLEMTHASFMTSYNRVRSQRYLARALSKMWKSLK